MLGNLVWFCAGAVVGLMFPSPVSLALDTGRRLWKRFTDWVGTPS